MFFFVLLLTEVNSFVLLLQFFNRYSPNLFKMRWSSFVINHNNAPFTSRLQKLILSLFISSKNDLLSLSYKGQSIKKWVSSSTQLPRHNWHILFYYILILFKQFYWLSCCHLTFRKIWYCLIKNRIDLVSLPFSFNVIKQLVFCISQYKFLWTLEINIHLSLKASVNIVFKVHKKSYWPQQKTIIV